MLNPIELKTTSPKAPSIILLSLDTIYWHSLVEDLPRWDDSSPELRELADDIASRGIDTPLIVTKTQDGEQAPGNYYLVDGRHRFLAARLAGLEEIPAKIVDESEAAGVVLNSLFQRRHYTKSAQALLLYEMFPGLQTRAGRRGNPTGANQHGGIVTGVTIPQSSETAEDFAARRGIPRQYFSCINTVRTACRTPQEWEMVRAWILEGEKSWTTALPALEGWQATHHPHEAGEGEAAPVKPPVDVFKGFKRSFTFIANQAARWSDLEEAERRQLAHMWFELRKLLPRELV